MPFKYSSVRTVNVSLTTTGPINFHYKISPALDFIPEFVIVRSIDYPFKSNFQSQHMLIIWSSLNSDILGTIHSNVIGNLAFATPTTNQPQSIIQIANPNQLDTIQFQLLMTTAIANNATINTDSAFIPMNPLIWNAIGQLSITLEFVK